MSHLRTALTPLLFLLAATAIAPAQLAPLHYRLQISFPAAASDPLQATVTVRVHTPIAERVVNFTLADGLKLGSVAIEGQTYRPAHIGPNRYTLLMVVPWRADTDHDLTFHYTGVPPAPNHVRREDVLLTPGSGWYPQFGSERPFTTEVDLQPPVGVQVMTRGEMQQENSVGVQTWVDAQPGTSLGLVWKRGLAADELDEPGLQVQGVCPSMAPAECSRAVAAFGKQVNANYTLFARRYGQPRRSRIIPVVISEALTSLQGGPRLYFSPPPAAIWPPERSLELAASVSRLWWNLSSAAPMDAWLRDGLPLISALQAIGQEQGRDARLECTKWLQQTARRDDQALHPAAADPSADPPADPPSAMAPETAAAARAALVLNALRLEVGTDDFEEALAAFQELGRRNPEAATTANFEKTVAGIAHMRLDWFWSQWLERVDLPQIEFGWKVVRLPRSGQTVRVQIRQAGHAFGFRAPIVIVSGGKRYVQSIEVHNADTILGIPVKGKLDTVEFDPDEQLLRAAETAPPAIKNDRPPAPPQRRRRGRSKRPLQRPASL